MISTFKPTCLNDFFTMISYTAQVRCFFNSTDLPETELTIKLNFPKLYIP